MDYPITVKLRLLIVFVRCADSIAVHHRLERFDDAGQHARILDDFREPGRCAAD